MCYFLSQRYDFGPLLSNRNYLYKDKRKLYIYITMNPMISLFLLTLFAVY